jgi:hypothetical protein
MRVITVELSAEDDLHFVGRVVASDTGIPIDGARVRLMLADESYSMERGRTWKQSQLAEKTTGPDGLFELSVSSWKSAHCRVEAAGYALALVPPSKGHASTDSALIVRLDRGATLKALVLAEGGSPIVGAQIRLAAVGYKLGQPTEDRFSSSFSLPDQSWNGTTDSSGRCTIESLSPGVALDVQIVQSETVLRHEGDPLLLTPGEVLEREWRLGTGCRVVGSVTDQTGQHVAGLELWLTKAHSGDLRRLEPHSRDKVAAKTRTDGDGHYLFEDVAAGAWWIGPKPEMRFNRNVHDSAVAPFPDDLEVPVGVGEIVHDMHAFRGLFIRGRVVDAKEAPVAQPYVMGGAEETKWFVDCQGEDDGSFSLGPLVPGHYSLSAIASTQGADSEQVTAQAGDSDVVLRMRPSGSVSGRVIDAASGQPCRAEVGVARHSGTSTGLFVVGSQDDGLFQCHGLQPDSYDVTAKTSDGRIGRQIGVVVSAGEDASGLVITLQKGATLRIHYTGRSGFGAFSIFSDGSAVAGDGIEAGATVSHTVPGGKLVVRLWVPPAEQAEERTIEIAIGEEKEITFGNEK